MQFKVSTEGRNTLELRAPAHLTAIQAEDFVTGETGVIGSS